MTRTKVLTVSAGCTALAIGAAAGAGAQTYEQPPTAKPAGCPQTGLLVEGTAAADTNDSVESNRELVSRR